MTDRRRTTHYATLSVHPKATAEEIRAAYRRAARDAHPDRHGDASSERMATVNEAWSVLGDPNRRVRYDQEIALTDRETIGSAASGPMIDRRMPAQVLVPTGDLSRFPWKFFGVMGVLAITVVLIGSLLGDDPKPVQPDNFLVQGDCVTVDEARLELAEVACTSVHDAKVQSVLNFDDLCPTGTEEYRDPQGRGIACVLRVPV